jgi:hypothetical protein
MVINGFRKTKVSRREFEMIIKFIYKNIFITIIINYHQQKQEERSSSKF